MHFSSDKQVDQNDLKRSALKFVVLLGVVSLLADMTYEGARAITGPFLAVLGASATVVGVVSGAGELLGYGLRLFSGLIADRTKQFWTITIIGYAVNLLAVPLLALAGSWELAAALIVMERIGKAIRTPARDAMLSHATGRLGQGWGFGLHEAMDQIGALLGPLIVSVVLFFKSDFRTGFAVLGIPAVFVILVLFIAKHLYPIPSDLSPKIIQVETKGLRKTFWIYLAAVAFVAAGYADFPLIAFHFEKAKLASSVWIPVLYSIAMGVDAIAALVFGRMFDKIGMKVLIGASFISAFFAPLVFMTNFYGMIAGVAIWGIGMGAQESIMRAQVALLTPPDRRGAAYGVFNMGYGIFWFLGSALMGVLYDRSIMALVIFSSACQLASIPLLAIGGKRNGKERRA